MGMTNEEVINTLKSLKDYYNDKSEYCEDGYVGFDNEDNEAIDKAIKALEQQPCEDCISREEVRQAIGYVVYEYGIKSQDFANALLERVNDLPSVTPQQTRWIPVSERLPEKDEVVLITNKWHEVDKALYIGGEMFDIIINYLQKEEVIAWMPLPEPYKAESEVKADDD